MILKTLIHDRGTSDCWNFYDNIESASTYYDENSHSSCVAIRYKGASSAVVISITETAYLCNDQGKTIEVLRPAVKDNRNRDFRRNSIEPYKV